MKKKILVSFDEECLSILDERMKNLNIDRSTFICNLIKGIPKASESVVVSIEPVIEKKDVESKDLVYKSVDDKFAMNDTMRSFWAGKTDVLGKPIEKVEEKVENDFIYDESI